MAISIQRQRFWSGTAMVIMPVVSLLLAISPYIGEKESGPIEGHVSLQGRPLAGYLITFMPKDPRDGNWVTGPIDNNGHFLFRSGWYRGALQDKVGFRIFVTPDPTAALGKVPHVPDRAGTAESRSGAKAEGCPGMDANSNVSRRLSDLDTTRLEVQLDSSPIHIDISL